MAETIPDRYVVAVLPGDYLGERSALKRAAKAARPWLAANPSASTC